LSLRSLTTTSIVGLTTFANQVLLSASLDQRPSGQSLAVPGSPHAKKHRGQAAGTIKRNFDGSDSLTMATSNLRKDGTENPSDPWSFVVNAAVGGIDFMTTGPYQSDDDSRLFVLPRSIGSSPRFSSSRRGGLVHLSELSVLPLPPAAIRRIPFDKRAELTKGGTCVPSRSSSSCWFWQCPCRAVLCRKLDFPTIWPGMTQRTASIPRSRSPIPAERPRLGAGGELDAEFQAELPTLWKAFGSQVNKIAKGGTHFRRLVPHLQSVHC